MNDKNPSSGRREFRSLLRLEAACEFSAVREAARSVCDWLAEARVPAAELEAWELLLVEAANNAVGYARDERRGLPVVIEVSHGAQDIEARVTDHTAGFDWPGRVDLPNEDSESGRGLFLIESLAHKVAYLRHPDGNVLVLRRPLPVSNPEVMPNVTRLQNQLAEAETALTEMTAELASSYESLVAVFRYSSELGAHADLKDFSRRLMRDLMQIAEADSAVLRRVSADGKKLETFLILPGEDNSVLAPVDLAGDVAAVEVGAARNREDIWFGPEEPLEDHDPLCAVMPSRNGICHAFFVAEHLLGTATLGRVVGDKPFSAAQVNLLHTFIDFLAIQIVNARLLDERTAARVTRRELQIAADIQRSLLPAKIPASSPFDLAVACQSASQVGGDFYDIIPAGDGALLLVIADVMGKGVPAALFAAVLRSTIRSMPQLFDQPGELLATANRTLFPDLTRVDMFVTAQVAYLNPRRHQIVCASAGHCPLLVWLPGEREAQALSESGFPLGIEPLTRYAQIETDLPPNAVALLYTDGLSETRNAHGEMLGEKNLLEILARTAAQTRTATAGRAFLLDCLAEFCNHAPLADDQTILLIRHLA